MQSSSKALEESAEDKCELSLEEMSDLEYLVVDDNDPNADASRSAVAPTIYKIPASIASSRPALMTDGELLMRSLSALPLVKESMVLPLVKESR